MSLGIMPMSTGFAPIKKERPSRPWVMDETLPRPDMRTPDQILSDKMEQRILNQAKSKPIAERNPLDWLTIISNDIKNKTNNPQPPYVCYIA